MQCEVIFRGYFCLVICLVVNILWSIFVSGVEVSGLGGIDQFIDIEVCRMGMLWYGI